MASELASVVQSTHIQHHPSVEYDINPSTAASKKYPAEIISQGETPSHIHEDEPEPLDEEEDDDTSSTSTVPSDIIRPRPRQSPSRHQLPLPDLRFEQTYLASIKNADTHGKVAYITIRDQVLLPLIQGIGYHLIISGWKYWNRGTKFTGQTLGARVRKWWWGVNGWKIPEAKSDYRVAKVENFYVGQSGTSLGD